jgi:importin subunit alpha-6/7
LCHPANKRSASFKKTVDSSDGKLAREQTTLQIRKQKKDEQIRRKRSQAQMMEENYDVTPVSACFPSRKASDNDIPDLATIVMKPVYSLADKVEATRRLRRLLVKERNPPLEQVIASGVLPYFVRNLTHTSSHTLVFETVWALTNIASHRTREIVAAGCVAPLVPLLGNADPNVREQAMWCLGNIAGEGAVDRDAVLALHPTPYL